MRIPFLRHPESSASLFDEDKVVVRLLNGLDCPRFCVDIGASDGTTMSNSLRLYSEGWGGLAVEYDGPKFATLAALHSERAVALARARVAPSNVGTLLAAAGTPRDFGVLTLDIDGFDYFVLDALLTDYRPTIVCTEINEKIPPPLKFTVNYSDHYSWDTSHFYGQSLSQLEVLCQRHSYSIGELEYNNAFLMPAEIAPRSLAAAEAYELGYRSRPNRLERMPWNADVEALQTMTADEAMRYVGKLFSGHEGQFSLSL